MYKYDLNNHIEIHVTFLANSALKQTWKEMDDSDVFVKGCHRTINNGTNMFESLLKIDG